MKKVQEKDQTGQLRQFDRFVETARAHGCDEDKEKFEAQLGKIATGCRRLASDATSQAQEEKKRKSKKHR